MPRVTVFNNQEQEVYSFPLNDLPVFIGRGENCDYQLPDLPAFGQQLRIEWKSQERHILATRLTPDCEVELDGQRLSNLPTVWADGLELRIGSYKFRHDLFGGDTPATGDRFIVAVQQAHRNLALTPGRDNQCLLTINNHSAREVDCNISAMVDGRVANWITGTGLLVPQFMANEERSVTLHFKAPRASAVKAGPYRAMITARSTVENYSAGSDSVALIVEQFFQHGLKIERLLRDNPIFGLMFRKTRFNLKIANQGNCPDNYELQVETEADASEQAQYWFAGSDAKQTELEIESGESRATTLFTRHPLLWLPLWKKHSFNIRSISKGARRASAEGNQIDSQHTVRFTQFSVIWLILTAILVGWLSWQGIKILMGPGFAQPPIASLSKLDVNREGGNPDDPIKAGEPVTVTWDAPYASVVDIYQVGDNGVLKEIVKNHNAGEKKFTISNGFEKTVKLRVIARNSFGQVEKDTEVPINFVPARVQFNPTSPVRIVLEPASGGQSSGIKIEWVVEGKAISGVTFDGESVEKTDSRYKSPTAPTTFDLIVNYSNGQPALVKKFDVIVIQPTPTPIPSPTPSPTPLRCDPSNQFSVKWPETSDKAAKRPATAIKKGDEVILTWSAQGADSVRIMQEEGGSGRTMLLTSSQASGSQPIYPQRRTTYTLILVKSGQEVECKSVAVAVKCRYGRKTPPFYEWRDCQ